MQMSPISCKRWWIAAATGFAVILAPGAAMASPGHPAGPVATSASACTGWTVTKTPNPGSPGLTGVATTSPASAWAVGYYLNHHSGASTLIARWNGTAWKQVPSPNPGGPTGANYLFGVAATSATNAWAVGSGNLIEHWNGTAWTQVPSHDPSPGGFAAVAATSASNVWAVGTYASGSVPETLVEHWTGTRWGRLPSPSPGKDLNSLDGVAATSATNAWAVGFYSQHHDRISHAAPIGTQHLHAALPLAAGDIAPRVHRPTAVIALLTGPASWQRDMATCYARPRHSGDPS
jgi:hypothetical protein